VTDEKRFKEQTNKQTFIGLWQPQERLDYISNIQTYIHTYSSQQKDGRDHRNTVIRHTVSNA